MVFLTIFYELVKMQSFACNNRRATSIDKLFEADYGKSSISVFQEIFPSADKIFISEGELRTMY